MKKMTAKEFKQALEDAGYYFDIIGYEGILNSLSAYEHRNATDMEAMNLMAGARGCRNRADKLYNILDARGYYDDVRNPQ